MYDAVYVQWAQNDGSSSIRVLKVYTFAEPDRGNGPLHFYQMREVVGAMNVGQYQYWHKWYKARGRPNAFAEFCGRVGASPVDWKISIKQARALNWGACDMAALVDEVVCSSVLLIAHMADWSTRLQQKARQMARLVLNDIFNQVIPARFEGVPFAFWGPPDRHDDLCMQPAGDESSTCLHCGSVREGLLVDEVLPPQRMASLLIIVWESRKKCGLMRRWGWALVQNFGQMMDECFGDDSNWQASATNLVSMRSVVRRARIDKDLKRNGIQELLTSGRVKSAAQAARTGLIDASVGACKDFEDESMRGYFANSYLTFRSECMLNIAFDESTISRETTLVTAVCAPRKRQCAWLVPQVLVD